MKKAVVEFVKAVVGRILIWPVLFLFVWLFLHVTDWLAGWPIMIRRTKALRILLVEARRIRSKARGRCPRFAPPFRIWDITHPCGVVANPACGPVNRRFGPL